MARLVRQNPQRVPHFRMMVLIQMMNQGHYLPWRVLPPKTHSVQHHPSLELSQGRSWGLHFHLSALVRNLDLEHDFQLRRGLQKMRQLRHRQRSG